MSMFAVDKLDRQNQLVTGFLLKNTNMSEVLFSPQIFNEAILAGQIEEVEQEVQSVVDLGGLHPEDPAEVHHRLLDGELAVERDLLRHVADAFPGNPRALRAGFPAQNPYLSRVKSSATDDAGEESGLAAPRGSQKTISKENNPQIRNNSGN